MENNKQAKEKLFTFEFTKEEIAIIKAGLQYYWLGDDFGYALWGTMPGATVGISDRYYARRVGVIYEKLKKASKVKPNYGWWGSIKTIAKLCKAEYKKAKKEGEEAEDRMFEDAVCNEAIQNELDKLGLNGAEILSKAAMVSSEKLKLEREKRNKNKYG